MLNYTFSTMKTLISPSLSTLSPILSNPRSSFSSISLPLLLKFPNFSNTQNFNFVHVKPMYCHNSSSSNGISLHTEASKQPSGEIHVILGPMFAGKTTTLLHRVRSESLKGRLELGSLGKLWFLDKLLYLYVLKLNVMTWGNKESIFRCIVYFSIIRRVRIWTHIVRQGYTLQLGYPRILKVDFLLEVYGPVFFL